MDTLEVMQTNPALRRGRQPASSECPAFLKLLAHAQRWRLVQELAGSDRRVGELVSLVGQPQNLVSYHLRLLRGQGLVKERRSSADQRDVYYSLDLSKVELELAATAQSLHAGLATGLEPDEPPKGLSPGVRVLVLCTHNSARSQMAEGLLRHLSGGKVAAASAGTEATRVHPLAIAAMAAAGIDISGQRSKHLSELLGQQFHYVITVCDHAGETCPVFPGAPQRIHWSIADPAAVEGSDEERLRAFQRAMVDLRTRIGFFLNALARNPGQPS